MDKINTYREIVKKVLQDYIALDNRTPDPDVLYYLIADETNDNYLWMNLGWKNGKRINKPTVHVRLYQGKIWIEEDWTGDGITDDLLDAGVPKEDIVLAFHPPNMRQYTEFAAA